MYDKLVFLILGELSAGELTLQYSFQAGLPKTRYESYIVQNIKRDM